MKRCLYTLHFALILFPVLFHSDVLAQGCDQVVVPGLQWHCCGTYYQPTSSCGSGQIPNDYSNFCYLGSGDCCDHEYYNANVTVDTDTCGYCISCPRGDFSCGNPPPACLPSPIVIDTDGKGFDLTDEAHGVVFDIYANGHPVQVSWTSVDSRNAWLALDRNGNGRIDNASELFGDHTPQPPSDDPNGFLALAVFDKPENGGNGDGIIDKRAVFSQLLLWIDENHDGVSQPNELHHLPELGVYSLALKYTETRRTDRYGNLFRYKAAVNPDPKDGHSEDGRWTYDVFLLPGATHDRAKSGHRLHRSDSCDRRPRLVDGLDLGDLGFDAEDFRISKRTNCGGGQ